MLWLLIPVAVLVVLGLGVVLGCVLMGDATCENCMSFEDDEDTDPYQPKIRPRQPRIPRGARGPWPPEAE